MQKSERWVRLSVFCKLSKYDSLRPQQIRKFIHNGVGGHYPEYRRLPGSKIIYVEVNSMEEWLDRAYSGKFDSETPKPNLDHELTDTIVMKYDRMFNRQKERRCFNESR